MGRDDSRDRDRRFGDRSRDRSLDHRGRDDARGASRDRDDRRRGRDRSRSPKRRRGASRDRDRSPSPRDGRGGFERPANAPPRGDRADAPAPAPKPRGEPLSVEDLLRRRTEEAAASAKPTFVSKKDREAAALKRREEEVAARRERTDGFARPAAPFASAADDHRARPGDDRARGAGGGSSGRRDEFRGRSSRPAPDPRARELELIKAQYMGQEKVKKKPAKPSDKFKFKFDWDKDQDTSEDANPLYAERADAGLLFGRGMRAGVDRGAQIRDRGERHHRDAFERPRGRSRANEADDRRAAGARASADRSAARRYAAEEEASHGTHWSEKALEEMTERDWRIFREDHNITTRGGRLPKPMRSWGEATMPAQIVRAIEAVGYSKPSPIQMASIPIGLLKRDVIGIAETGSGKTCAFVVPMLAYIMELPKMTDEVATKGPYALVMAPTRELAQQIEEETTKFAKFLEYRVCSVVGGQDIEQQGFKLRRGCEIVIGTPGRVIDVLERRYTVLQQCDYIVLDEADRMIDMGFEPQVNAVMDGMRAESMKPEEDAEAIDESAIEKGQVAPTYRMTYMFSATMPPSVERLARKYLRNPAVVNIGSAGKTSDLIKQIVKWTTKNEKPAALELALSQYPDTQAIVFVNTKRAVDAVVAQCQKMGYSVASLHGGKSQDQREESLRGFKAGEYDVLVATDVAGRGIDVKGIDLVVNYELPHVIENYTHRIGRTGRAGRQGTAVAFVTSEDVDVMYDLKELLKNSGNHVPPELERHEASKVKPMRDARGGKMTREQLRGMEDIIH